MITVHHLNNSRSQRILWLLEELNLPYEIKYYERDKKTMLAPPTLCKVHPLGKSPVVTDGENTLAESGAIIEYLVNKYAKGHLRPAVDTPAFLKYTFWLHFAEGSAMSPLLLSLIFNKIKSQKVPFFIKPITRKIADQVLGQFINPNITSQMNYIESELSQNLWFSGDQFTAADIQMSFPLEAAMTRGLQQNYPSIINFLTSIHARPAYQKALAKGGPYSIL